MPFFGNDKFSELSPMRRIPVLIDGDVTLCDSTVICEYIEDRFPTPSLLPATPAERGRARWLEEFADTRLGDVFIWRFFYQLVVRRFVWREEPDERVVEQAREVEIPRALDYLERELPAGGDFFFGEIGIADIAIAAFFRNAAFARFVVDGARWPKTAAFVERAFDHPCLAELRPFEELLLRTPIPEQREALAAAGAPLTPRSVGSDTPRRGVFDLSRTV